MRYKILRDGRLWSLGYPTKTSAQAAARSLNKSCGPHPQFVTAPMTRQDYKILRDEEVLSS